MARPISKVAPEWWDYTTLDAELLEDAAKITEKTLIKLSRPGFQVHYYETLEDFYLAEALECLWEGVSLPLVGLRRVARILIVVDLPAPFGPRKPKICPA